MLARMSGSMPVPSGRRSGEEALRWQSMLPCDKFKLMSSMPRRHLLEGIRDGGKAPLQGNLDGIKHLRARTMYSFFSEVKDVETQIYLGRPQPLEHNPTMSQEARRIAYGPFHAEGTSEVPTSMFKMCCCHQCC